MQLQNAAAISSFQRRAIHPTAQTATKEPAVKTNKHLWHKHYDVSGFPTELWGMQATQTPKAQVLVVPGNPGLGAFYRVFMQQLHSTFDGAADVLAVSHLGHDGDNLSRGSVWGLDDQVQHKVQLLRQLMAPGRPPVVILAHSIGSYIMLQALKQLETAAGSNSRAGLQGISKVFLLMPFLTVDWSSWEQQVLAAVARHHGGRFASAVDLLQNYGPRWMQDAAVRLMLQPGAEPHAAESLRAALNGPALRNNWHLAAQEFRELDAPVDWGVVKRLGNKAVVVYNPADIWFKEYDSLRQVLPGVEAYADEGLGHAFCLSTDESQTVARLVHQSVMMQGAAAAAPYTPAVRTASKPGLQKAPAFNSA